MTHSRLTATLVDPARVIVLDSVRRRTVKGQKADPQADEILHRSIRDSGIQQPLVLVSDGDRLLLVDGLRRLMEAMQLEIPRVPVVIEVLPAEREAEEYIRETRFILDEHRQDLLPTQKGELIAELKEVRGFTNKDLAHFLGCNIDSIYNWLACLKYIKPVQMAMDLGHLNMRAARVFDGMSENGQEMIWKRHSTELVTARGRTPIHKKLRAAYPPSKHPELYTSAAQSAGNANRKPTPGQKKRTPAVDLEKRRLLGDMRTKEEELVQLKDEIRDRDREIVAAAPIIGAMLRTPKLKALIPDEMLEELEVFAKAYCE